MNLWQKKIEVELRGIKPKEIKKTQNMRNNKIKFIPILLLFIYGCKTANTLNDKKVENKNSISNVKNFTIFLSFTINNENLNKNSVVELVDKKIQSGSFKTQKNDTFENILIFDLYENNIFVKSYSIEHPLYKNAEFVDDNFNLNTKSIKLTTAEFFLRIHTNSEKFLIKLFEKIGQKEKKIIKTISI